MVSRLHLQLRWLVVIAVMLFGGSLARPAEAAVSVCRGDPVLWLSNGLKLDMSVVIEVDGDLVRDVTYTLHAPDDVTITKIVYTGGELKGKEIVQLVNDSKDGVYRADTVVRTYTPTKALVTAVFEGQWGGDSTTGLTGRILSVTLYP